MGREPSYHHGSKIVQEPNFPDGFKWRLLAWLREFMPLPQCVLVYQHFFNPVNHKDYFTKKVSNFDKIMSFFINLNIKFRFCGVTLGRFNQSIAVIFDPLQKNFSIEPTNQPVPIGARVLVNERGILLSGWL